MYAIYIYGNIDHQYTPFMLAYIPAPWIRHGDDFPMKTSKKYRKKLMGFPSQPCLKNWRVASWWFFTTEKAVMSIVILLFRDGICFKRDTVDPYLLVKCICYYMNPYIHMYLYIYTYIHIHIIYNITVCNSYSFVLYQNYAHKIFGLCHLFVGWNYVKFSHANIISYHIPTWPWDPSAELALLASC